MARRIVVNRDKCTGCGICVRNCPVQAVSLVEGKASIGENCVGCTLCVRMCPLEALTVEEVEKPKAAKCFHCPVECEIPEGRLGACKRYTNVNGRIELAEPLVVPRKKPLNVEEAVREKAKLRRACFCSKKVGSQKAAAFQDGQTSTGKCR